MIPPGKPPLLSRVRYSGISGFFKQKKLERFTVALPENSIVCAKRTTSNRTLQTLNHLHIRVTQNLTTIPTSHVLPNQKKKNQSENNRMEHTQMGILNQRQPLIDTADPDCFNPDKVQRHMIREKNFNPDRVTEREPGPNRSSILRYSKYRRTGSPATPLRYV